MYLRVDSGPPVEGLLSYLENEYSFRFQVTSPDLVAGREGGAGRASVSIGTLQIEVGASTGMALFAWGLHPRTIWIERRLPGPSFKPGVVTFHAEFEAAVSLLVASVGEWTTVYDRDSGWLRVANNGEFDEVLTEIANGILLGEKRGELNSVWLKPGNI
jgi:hypothetical protein